MTFAIYSQVIVATVLLGIAVATLRAAPRRGANQQLAFYLLLVAANFASNFFGDYFDRVADDTASYERSYFLGFIFLVMDPAVLLYFSSIFPSRRGIARIRNGPAVLLVLVVALYLLVALGEEKPFNPRPSTTRFLLFSYFVGCYLGALYLIVTGWIRAHEPRRQGVMKLLVIAFGAMVIPRMGLVPLDLGYSWSPLNFGITAGLFAVVFGFAWFRSRKRGREVAIVAGMSALLIAIVTSSWIPLAFSAARGLPLEITSAFTYRWFVFAFLVSYAILRYQVFDVDLHVKRGVSMAIQASLLVLSFFLLRWGTQLLFPEVQVPVPEVVGILGAVIAVMPAGKIAKAGAGLFLPGARSSQEFLHHRKMEVYGAALEGALDEAKDPEDDEELRRLRIKLGLSTSDCRSIQAVVEAERMLGGRRYASLRKGLVLRARYRVGDQIGAGRHGRVYLAEDLQESRRLVLKELRPEWRGDEAARRRFEQEAELLKRLDHPNVVKVFDTFEVGGSPFLVLEFLEGGTLQQRLRKRTPPTAQAVRTARELLEGLNALHALGIVHRDVKPGNVFLTKEGVAKLGDLGVAHVEPSEESTLTSTGEFPPGTLPYMSPEQARGTRVDERSDLYSLGAVLYEMLTSAPPISLHGLSEYEARQAIQRRRPRFPIPGVPAGLSNGLARALARDPEQRYASAHEFSRALEPFDAR